MTKEPVAIIAAISALVIGILPVLAAFGLVSWSIEQFGVVEVFVVLVTTTLGTVFTRSKVTPVDAS